MKITPEAVRWAYRLFLDREPENEEVTKREFGSTADMRRTFMGSTEYLDGNINVDISDDLWVIKETKYGFKININLFETAICKPILFDQYDVIESEFILRNITKGENVLDIGANIGYYSLLMSTCVGETGKITSYEPLPNLFHWFTKSIAVNNFTNIDSHNEALGDIDGELLLRHAPKTLNFGGAHFAEDTTVPAHHEDVKVKVSRLDSQKFAKPITFVKMDVEGAEPLVIKGGMDFFTTHKPMILSEIHPPQLKAVGKTAVEDYLNIIKSLGYNFYLISDSSGQLEKIETWSNDKIGNVLFIHKDDKREIKFGKPKSEQTSLKEKIMSVFKKK